MAMIQIDPDTLRSLIYGAVSEAMQPYTEQLSKHSERILKLETINERDEGRCPQGCPCQVKIDDHDTRITKATESTKSAHHRIDGVYNTAVMVAGAGSGVVTLILIAIEMLLKWQSMKAGG